MSACADVTVVVSEQSGFQGLGQLLCREPERGPDTVQVVVAPPELHRQVITTPDHDASLTGEIRAPASAIAPMPLDERRVIAARAMLELARPHAVVNLGIGMPEVRAAPMGHPLGLPLAPKAWHGCPPSSTWALACRRCGRPPGPLTGLRSCHCQCTSLPCANHN